jgi:hypothetical protein
MVYLLFDLWNGFDVIRACSRFSAGVMEMTSRVLRPLEVQVTEKEEDTGDGASYHPGQHVHKMHGSKSGGRGSEMRDAHATPAGCLRAP